jgi:hypothetical protein
MLIFWRANQLPPNPLPCQVGIQPELAAVLCSADHPAFLRAWALLCAHLLSQPPGSPSRQRIHRALQEAMALVSAALNAVVEGLPQRGPSLLSTAGGDAIPDGVAAALVAQLAEVGMPAPDNAAQQVAFSGLLYSALLFALPSEVRLWYGELRDRGTIAALRHYTMAHVSPWLLAREYSSVEAMAGELEADGKFSVRASLATREVLASLQVEEGHRLELVISLPATMPLSPPEPSCKRSVSRRAMLWGQCMHVRA